MSFSSSAVTVTRSAGTYGSSAYTGSSASWANSNNTNLGTSDNGYASYTGANLDADGEFTNYIKCNNWGFSANIPANAVINGITVLIERHDGTGGGTSLVSDKALRLSKTNNTTFVGDDKASATLWATADPDSYVTYGGAADLWNTTWTAAEINSSNFAVLYSAQKTGAGTDDVFPYVDHITVTIDYSYALPVELLSFIVEKIGDKYVHLEWATASEINNDYFEVQKSTDGINWYVIAVVQGGGNKTITSVYHSKDEAPVAGINYYRLKQVDYDGSYKFTNIVYANFRKVDFYVSIYPNPASEELNVQLPSDLPLDEVIHIQLFDVLGNIVTDMSVTSDNKNFTLPVAAFSKGEYFVLVTGLTSRYTENLILK